MLSPHQWDIFRQMNEAGAVLDLDFAVDKFDTPDLPEQYKGQFLLLMRKKSDGVVYGYHPLDISPEILQGFLHGVLFTLTTLQNYMQHEAKRVVEETFKDVLNPTNRLENKNGN